MIDPREARDWDDVIDQCAMHDDTLKQEQMVLTALAECARAGSPPDALEILAHELGVAREFDRMRP